MGVVQVRSDSGADPCRTAALIARHHPLGVIAGRASGVPLAAALAGRLGLPGVPVPPPLPRAAFPRAPHRSDEREYTVETVSCAGRHVVVAVRRHRTRRQGPFTVPDRTSLAAPGHGPVSALIARTRDTLDALGITHGPARTCLVLTSRGPQPVSALPLLGDVLPGYDDLCLGTNLADLTALAHARPEEFLDRWAGADYSPLCEADVLVTGVEPHGTADRLGQDVIDAIESLPSVYCFDPGTRPGTAVRTAAGRRACTGVIHTLHRSRRQLALDRLRIRRLTRPQEKASCPG
ncbi:hypothetical protein OHA98_38905 [Streptomyces sp. NBC_00654]|uniref:hypothetical protein n=1 Tax=Streptomyces sp. NBC_00654 TaxID=2975799 RepID=UPI00224F875D|nr:hypothetical protein [Streptomyces sp. NBC_00654]MCX4970621.1 hypothetical protein [Streptomyces sp. NBC_00654]